jgi:two-component system alkaline phosphatase synthesis response regulator PhoP
LSRRIFIIDDEPDMVRIATDLLSMDGFVVNSANHPNEGIKQIRCNPPDLLLLDIRLPDKDGFQVCKELKSDPKTKFIPIIMISVKSDETDIVVGLEMGADDYISKPFRQKELLARVKTVLRRQEEEPEPPMIEFGPLKLDTKLYKATLNGRNMGLTLKEFELLSFLVRMEGRVLTRTRIYEAVWGVNFTGSSRTIDVHVDQVRKKLGKFSDWLTTLRGIGYRFEMTD